MAKVSNEKKLEAVKKWLSDNGIEYVENYKTKNDLTIDLWIQRMFIAIHLGDDDGFYKKTYRWCKPFFIRDGETQAFVLEKIQNCCFDQMIYLQKRFETQIKKKKQ